MVALANSALALAGTDTLMPMAEHACRPVCTPSDSSEELHVLMAQSTKLLTKADELHRQAKFWRES